MGPCFRAVGDSQRQRPRIECAGEVFGQVRVSWWFSEVPLPYLRGTLSHAGKYFRYICLAAFPL